jgi:hypothetical protein
MTGQRLLWLYPRAWRERYGDEFVAIVGDRQLALGEWIDIVSGAIDARLSSDVRRAAASNAAGGAPAMTVLQALKLRQCGKNAISTREALVGAAVLIAGSLATVAVKYWLVTAGRPEAGRLVTEISFPALYIVVTNVWYLRGQPWRARLVISAILVAIFGLATMIARMT